MNPDKQVDCSDDDPERWAVRPVVVEVKHRVRRVATPAPLHDQLQLFTYMLMTGCDAGDLVQCVRGKAKETTTRQNIAASSPSDKESKTVAEDGASLFRIDRVEASAHRKDWDAYVVPRLFALARAVDALRRDVARRRAFLASSPRDRWLEAVDLCDWFPDPPETYDGSACIHHAAPPPKVRPLDDDTTTTTTGGIEPPRRQRGHIRHDRVDARHLDDDPTGALDRLPPDLVDDLRRRLPRRPPRDDDAHSGRPPEAEVVGANAEVSGANAEVPTASSSSSGDGAPLRVDGPTRTSRRRRRATVHAIMCGSDLTNTRATTSLVEEGTSNDDPQKRRRRVTIADFFPRRRLRSASSSGTISSCGEVRVKPSVGQ